MTSAPRSGTPANSGGSNQRPEYVVSGVLRRDAGAGYVETAAGQPATFPEPIWAGYTAHWSGHRVRVHRLRQRDYDSGARILLLAPDQPAPEPPFVELYYNERLPGYLSSLVGHLAINVDGRVFSFSETLNENEEMSPDEFFYRPAMGEFAAHPGTRGFNVADPDRPYYEKFGRRFMRSIHVLHIRGLDTARLTGLLSDEIRVIHETPPDPRRPHKYRDFHAIDRSCTSLIRDALREAGLSGASGIVPRELFLNVAYQAMRPDNRRSLSVRASRLEQLKVPERPFSRPSPIINPLNLLRLIRLRDLPGSEDILPPRKFRTARQSV